MNRTEIKLNTLSDSDRTGTENHDFLLRMILFYLIFTIKAGIIVRSGCFKLCCTGINDLIRSMNIHCISHSLDLSLCLSDNLANYLIREFHTFCFLHQFFIDFLSIPQFLLHLYQICDLIQEPDINLSNGMNLTQRNTSTDCFRNHKDTTVIYFMQTFMNLFQRTLVIIQINQTVNMLFQRPECLHQCAFEICTNTHNLSGRLHLCCQRTLCLNKLIKRQSRNLNNHIIQSWLKACIGLAGNCILNFIQIISEGNLCCYLCDRITGCLGCQCGRTAYTRIYFDHAVLKRIRIQCKLYIATALDIQLTNNIQSCASEHLMLFISQCL